MERTLLLNASFEPLKVVSWRKAITLVFLEKVEVIEVYDREVRSVSRSFQMPAVIRLLRYVRFERSRVKFSRDTIFLRDSYTCQYCHTRFPTSQLTCDHVVPRSLGGETNWENIVTACNSCNTKKGNMRLEHTPFQLKKPPVEPDWYQFLVFSLGTESTHPTWQTYLPRFGN